MGTPDVPPPSYEDSVATEQPQAPQQRPQRPIPPSASTSYQSTSSSSSSRPAPSVPKKQETMPDIYKNGDLPFSFPKGFLCSKCKNTGYKIKNGDICRRCWMSFYVSSHAYNPNPQLPFKYRKGYLCEKCENTGYKKKNGKSCKDCWSLFANRSSMPQIYKPSSTFNHVYNQVSGPGMPQRVPPGDPRLGGILCGRCRGSGLTHFLLDEELCHVCHGVGRVFPPQPAPQPQWIPPQAGPPQAGPPPPEPSLWKQSRSAPYHPQNYSQGYPPGPNGYKY